MTSQKVLQKVKVYAQLEAVKKHDRHAAIGRDAGDAAVQAQGIILVAKGQDSLDRRARQGPSSDQLERPVAKIRFNEYWTRAVTGTRRGRLTMRPRKRPGPGECLRLSPSCPIVD